jgi:hypothetical protein
MSQSNNGGGLRPKGETTRALVNGHLPAVFGPTVVGETAERLSYRWRALSRLPLRARDPDICHLRQSLIAVVSREVVGGKKKERESNRTLLPGSGEARPTPRQKSNTLWAKTKE